ncbi:hypothetical protein DL768_000022 [Monosporascus sp. mg162]|nr:hypothetical protein DL768_000022 [Monosporascus sp. mg162]
MSNSGGTLTLPSPTHVHHVDVQAGLRSLRRSLSRSPSKFSLVRTASSQSSSSAGSSPSSPSLRRVQSQYFGQNSSSNSSAPQSPLATPFRPSVKLSLRSAKSSKSPGIPSSSTKPALRTLESSASGQENLNVFGARSPVSRKGAEKPHNRHSMHLDIAGASSQFAMPRPADANSPIPASPVVSPLKRSDATMNLDQSSSGSPRPKRRSYGPSNFGSDFNVFDLGPGSPSPEIHEDTAREYEWTGSSTAISSEQAVPPTPSVMPRRAGSLRRSTLQQRHSTERTSWGRRHAAQQLSQVPNDATASPNAKHRPRLSMDHFLPPPQRDSPFNQAPLPNPSAHMLSQPAHQPHPLSRAMTTSSSSSSLVDESPTHAPMQLSERPRAPMNFSKSLPIGAVRPQPERGAGPVPSVSTPDYKHAKPYEGAFASTGLVSKMNRNPELGPPGDGSFGFVVPDTPCKNKISGFNTYPPPPGSGKGRNRHIRHSFGTPSTPFNPPSARSQNIFGEQPRPVLFNGFSRHSRKGSLLSLYSDDGRTPPEANESSIESMTGIDEGIPPTPTKQQLLEESSSNLNQLTNDSPTTHRQRSASTSVFGNIGSWQESGASSSPMDRLEFAEKASPRTPRDNIIPPDASRLSISQHADGSLFPWSAERRSIFPPATPTTRAEAFPFNQDRRAITPVNGMAPRDLDEGLVSRFGKVEYIGKGEFSQVYKVTESAKPAARAQQSFFSTPTHRTPPLPSGKFFAVKKLSLPFQGDKDRALRLREVSILKNLQGCDHVLQLIDSWEEKNNLYIQTEYCEEGSLDVFLSLVGLKGRLDDFRIWKIMLEISQGLRHIHDAGYVHLDLKPANILIDFEGTLKIGDFGLATSLPADNFPDLEGDREYLAPEALRSEIDKPADIFSLGLIMLEIAANVKLPENGATWTALREGDFSEVPTLTRDATTVLRDATGMPVDETDRSVNIFGGDSATKNARRAYNLRGATRHSGDIFGLARKNELQDPPDFMNDSSHRSSLDTVVRWMLAAEPMCRPTVSQLLQLESLVWTATRQRAGATVFEGNWGPADEVLEPDSVDTEMTDV